MRIFKSLILLSCLGLSACSTAPVSHEHISANNVEGLVGVSMNGTQNSANFNWFSDDQQIHIELYGPLGVGSTYLDGLAGSFTLTLSNQETYTAHSPELLMQDVLGWSIPVEGLKYWLFAEPMPKQPAVINKNSAGQIINLTQQGWNISYTWLSSQNYPHKMILIRPGIKVVIIINKVY